jgi:hypothetical protein
LAAKQVNGRQKRIFIAAVCEKLCDGSARKTEERFGWDHDPPAQNKLVPFGVLVLASFTIHPITANTIQSSDVGHRCRKSGMESY